MNLQTLLKVTRNQIDKSELRNTLESLEESELIIENVDERRNTLKSYEDRESIKVNLKKLKKLSKVLKITSR